MSSNGSAEPPDPDAAAVEDPATGPAHDLELRAARRTVALFAAALLAAAVGVVLVLVGSRGDDGPPVVADDESGAPSDGITEVIGPAPGTELPGYEDERRDVLRAVEGRYVAAVSLTGYSSLSTVDELLEGVEVDSYLVAMVADEPRLTTDVEETRDAVVAEAEEQLPEIEGLVPTVEDPEFVEFYESEIIRYRALLDEASRDDVVFGAVVHAPASELRALAARASVRLVDVGSSDRLAADAEVSGIRPEEEAVAGEPPFRP